MPGKLNNENVLRTNHFSKQLPSVAIVMVTRNRCAPLLRVLAQVRELDYPREMFDIFLLDGASTDGTVEKVQQLFPDINIISNKKNIGIAGAENTLITEVLKAGKYKYTWLLDDDAEIESQTLMPLIEAAEKDARIAVVGSAVYELDKRDQLITAGVRIVWQKSGLTYHIPRSEEISNLFDIEIIPACSSLVRTDLFSNDKVGLWDTHFWMYWPDNDWCLRALRKGYRICCHGKSKVWHRNWAETKRYFYTPYAVHSSIRGALLFYLRHSPLKSLASLRGYILKGYLKAAFEHFTLRPNFSRAFDEGVQDFLRGHLGEKDYSPWDEESRLSSLDEICRTLMKKAPKNPRILLNKIAGESQKSKIKEIFQTYFNDIRWEEIPAKSEGAGLERRERPRDYLFYHFPRMLLRLFNFSKRSDIIVSQVGDIEYNIVLAKVTVLIDPSLNGGALENKMVKGFINFFLTSVKGIRAAYIDLPYALKNCRELKKAIAAYPDLSQPSPPGLEDRKVKIM